MPETNVDSEALAKLLRAYAEMLDNSADRSLTYQAELVRELYDILSTANRKLLCEVLSKGQEELNNKLKKLDVAMKNMEEKLNKWEASLSDVVAIKVVASGDFIRGADGMGSY